MTKLKTCKSVGDAETRHAKAKILKKVRYSKKEKKTKAPNKNGNGLCMQRNGELQPPRRKCKRPKAEQGQDERRRRSKKK
jgi:hypothetical protein